MKSRFPYENRELSWLRFNGRVLAEAKNERNPLLERMKFLSIVSSNLDEFFMVRVASLRRQMQSGDKPRDPAGMKPSEQYRRVMRAARRQVKRQYALYRETLLPALSLSGIRLLRPGELSAVQLAWLSEYFTGHILPVLTPRAVDSVRRFPLLLSRTLNLGVLLNGDAPDAPRFAIVQAPSVLPRLVTLPSAPGETACVLLEDVIARFVGRLFGGQGVLCCQPFRITRNADQLYNDSDAATLMSEMKKALKKRQWSEVVRLEVPFGVDARLLAILLRSLPVEEGCVFRVKGPIDLTFCMKQLAALPGYDALRFAPFTPAVPDALREGVSVFDAIRAGDILLYHPYDSFEPVVRMMQQAAADPQVLAIKQTLYRVSGKSPIVAALAQAALSGKQVTVLLELRARFDEENNIGWCSVLEKAGCHVIYGLPKVKTHSKITLIVRKEEQGLRRYLHLGTGNYNDVTARLYTDMSLLTCDDALGQDASIYFNTVTGYSRMLPLRNLICAPVALRGECKRLILREIENAKNGLPAGITAKMNALVDPGMIELLYEASRAGVRVSLIVRGICCLRPGVKGVSENITVRSIVGRFLEHARIFRFENAGNAQTFLSSADWMPRNLNKRIELMFPVASEPLRRRIDDILDLQLRDTLRAWELGGNGRYRRVVPGEEALLIDSQAQLIPLPAALDRAENVPPAAQSG